MATTEYTVNHAMARQEWSRTLMKEALEETFFSKFMGTSKNAPIYVKNELKDSGYKVTYGLRMQLSGTGRMGDATLEGHEEALSIYTDSLVIDQLRHAVRTNGRASEQRVPFSTREEAKDGLKDWWARRMDQGMFNQLCGVTAGAAGGLQFTGLNTATTPTSTHHIFSGEDSEASLSDSANNRFTLSLIDDAVEKAKTLDPIIKPVSVGQGQNRYAMILHPNQVRDLRTQYSTTEITWYDATRALVEGGKGKNSPIYTGALGEYNGVILHESENIPLAPGNSEVRRAVMLGAQAGCVAFGKGYGANQMDWTEELFDYGNQLGVSSGLIFGMKKSVFNSADFASIVISTGAG
jgi:N4-gp56 family major capsid protein